MQSENAFRSSTSKGDVVSATRPAILLESTSTSEEKDVYCRDGPRQFKRQHTEQGFHDCYRKHNLPKPRTGQRKSHMFPVGYCK